MVAEHARKAEALRRGTIVVGWRLSKGKAVAYVRVLAVVPAFNEEDVILQTLATLSHTCPEVEILVVNDGSADSTAALVQGAGYHCVSLPVNCGLSCAFATGVRYARARGFDAVCQFDADGQHDARYLPRMVAAMEADDMDVVIASRKLGEEAQGVRGARGLGSSLISALIHLTTGVRITDPTSGYRLFSARLFDAFADGFDVGPEPDSLAWLIRQGARVEEVPCTMAERQGGRSYLSGLTSIAYMVRTCLNIVVFQWIRR